MKPAARAPRPRPPAAMAPRVHASAHARGRPAASLPHPSPISRPRLTSVGGRRGDAQRCSNSAKAAAAPMRLIQHKHEAFWFYRYLSIVYDKVVNPGHWTEEMRADALEPAMLRNKGGNLRVIDVGGGTGFSTTGIVQAGVPGGKVTLVDQSPHQLARAKAKPQLREVTIMEGDAEDLPVGSDEFDRYVSCGSIEYWPDPQRGCCEAFRVVKPGGLACMVGPVHPTHWLSRWMADAWMLFPTEAEYIEWFKKAGFEDVSLKRIGPPWYRGCRKHGLIMGCSVTGVKPLNRRGASPLPMQPKAETIVQKTEWLGVGLKAKLATAARVVLGSAAGAYYFVLPIYMWLKDRLLPKHIRFE